MELALILQYLPQIIAGGTEVIQFVQQLRTAAQQTGEWTDAQEQQFLALIAQEAKQPEQQPDKQ